MRKLTLFCILCGLLMMGCSGEKAENMPSSYDEISVTSAVTTAESEDESTVMTTQPPITAGIAVSTENTETTAIVTTVAVTETAILNRTESTVTTAPPEVTSKATTSKSAVATAKTEKHFETTAVTDVPKQAITTVTTVTTAPPKTELVVTTTDSEDKGVYIAVGQSLQHDGTDYGKAKAVYDWMQINGHGTCVGYSYQAYYVCKGIGLACYYVQTDAKLYGHVANIVKVNGIWFVLDTQGGFFLGYNHGFTEVVDETETVLNDGSMISNYSYDELFN